MKRVKPGAYTFNTTQSAFSLYSTNNILLNDSETEVVVNYTKAPLSGIMTDKYVLAVDRPDDTQRYTVYAYETTTAGSLSIEAGWYWFNETTSELVAIDAPTILLSATCTILNTVSSDQINAMFTEPPIETVKEYKREFWEGQRDTSMTDFEALSNVNSAMSYNITDYPNTGITNAQMKFALTAKRLFTEGETFICIDDGVYTKGHIYKLNIVNDSKSWEDITKSLTIYPVTDVLNHDGIKSGKFTEEQINNIKLADILQVYGINGDPVSKLAYKGLFPTNPVQSTINANLYFSVATEKGNYVLAINTDTRNWEVREPESNASAEKIQVTELAEPTSEDVGKIVQFVGEPDYEGQEPTNGHWYKGRAVNASEGRYEWIKQSVQEKDYSVDIQPGNTSSADIGKMKYIDSSRTKSWIPYIALGELSQLDSYQNGITLNYNVDSDLLPGGLDKTQEMIYSADDNGWVSIGENGFYMVSKLTNWFASETLTKSLYIAVYQSNDLTMENPKITITGITLSDGTEISIPTGYGEAKFYNYAANNSYSSPVDFYSKFNSGTLTDADLEAFRFFAGNEINSTFDISNLKLFTGTGDGQGWQSVKNLIGPDLKHSVIKNVDTDSIHEDVWMTEELDSIISIYHQNGTTQSGMTVSKEYVEIAVVDTTSDLANNAKVTLGNDTITLVAQDSAGNNNIIGISSTKTLFGIRPKVKTNGTESEVVIKDDLAGYVPVQSELSAVALTWRFNDTVDVNRDNFTVNFTSNSINFTTIGFKISLSSVKDTMYYSNQTEFPDVYYGNWGATPDTNPYRTVTFETAPSGELLTWLQANAIPQGSTSKTYAQITNEDGAISFRVFENGSADLQNLSITKDAIIINGKKPLTSIQPLYKHQIIISYSFSGVVAPGSDTATTINGSAIYHYFSNDAGMITDAANIDDMFMLPGAIAADSSNTVLLYDVTLTKVGNSITANAVDASTMKSITGTIGAITDTVTQLI